MDKEIEMKAKEKLKAALSLITVLLTTYALGFLVGDGLREFCLVAGDARATPEAPPEASPDSVITGG